MLQIHVTTNYSLFSVEKSFKAKRISKVGGEALTQFSNLPIVFEDSSSQGNLLHVIIDLN